MPAASRSAEIKLTRLYDAPVRAVWDAWMEPDQVAQWWGPRGFTHTTESKDVRPGGSWRYTMHGPDGTDYPNLARYLEVEPYARLVYDHGATDDTPPLFRVTVTFTDVRGKTRLDMSMTLPTPEAAEEARRFIKKAGGERTWDRLAEFLHRRSSGEEQFVINRSFDAPIARVFDMWTDAEHFTRWLPPAGAAARVLRGEIAAGKSSLIEMTGAAHGSVYVRFEYLAIEPPHRLVYNQHFADEAGRPARHPGALLWPMTLLTTVTFTEESPGTTRVTVAMNPQGDLSAAELAELVKERAGMTRGWSGSFDKLEALLESNA
jgi:uncharacterized protein YndB with AHSA1/START domain